MQTYWNIHRYIFQQLAEFRNFTLALCIFLLGKYFRSNKKAKSLITALITPDIQKLDQTNAYKKVRDTFKISQYCARMPRMPIICIHYVVSGIPEKFEKTHSAKKIREDLHSVHSFLLHLKTSKCQLETFWFKNLRGRSHGAEKPQNPMRYN